jgi:DNA-binding transcriptional LysR family regulator
VRHARGVSLTPAREAVLREAREILSRANRLKRVTSQFPGVAGVAFALDIGFIASASHFVLPEVLPALRAVHPEITVTARELLSKEQLAGLQMGALDAAICRLPVRAKTLTVAAELSDPFCLAIPRSHALAGSGPINLRAASAADFVSIKRDQARAFFDDTLHFFAVRRASVRRYVTKWEPFSVC